MTMRAYETARKSLTIFTRKYFMKSRYILHNAGSVHCQANQQP
jgi:hypothetical protein